ncbi:MAG: hypothetical protein L0H53_10480 [Candidatus Nitrosocosmicus sp.]|nr:hypothetical protein [Candidatus Nitrosocosmicus sp.]MDN5867994.1 hypothetical protein [Candidatus Nitrosocosmicus sp.]
MVRSSIFTSDSEKDDLDNPDGLSAAKLPGRLTSFGFEFYNRIKLFPWWLQYHKGQTAESNLKNLIIDLGRSLGLEDRWLKDILRHTISEFSKKGLGTDYYGYHNIQHELEAVYFTLLSISGINRAENFKVSQEETTYLFVAALFHDYDPLKEFDKPNEDCVEFFIRNDPKIREFIINANLNLDLVMILIHRTAYPFKGEIEQYATKKIDELFEEAGISQHDIKIRERFRSLGWFLSVSERIAGYALGNYEHARDIARRNAHALGWHPSVINKNSVKFFDSMMLEEKEMFDFIMLNVPSEFRKNFYDNVAYFKESWNRELGLKDSKRGIKLIFVTEGHSSKVDENTMKILLDINNRVSTLMRQNEDYFRRTIADESSILVTLRMNNSAGDVIGYAKGGPLENYELRTGTVDVNKGSKNTVYLEGVSVLEGYWGGSGGHYLRIKFLGEAIKNEYSYVTGYVHRDVINQRKKKSEIIEIVQKYDPDKLDYYRIDLNNSIYQRMVTDAYDIVC